MSVQALLDVLDRAHTGPVCSVKDWDTKVIPGKVSEKLSEHGLKGTCTPENPINTEDSLADEFWHAGFELAVDVGMLCLDTERVIKFTEEELKARGQNHTIILCTYRYRGLGRSMDPINTRHCTAPCN